VLPASIQAQFEFITLQLLITIIGSTENPHTYMVHGKMATSEESVFPQVGQQIELSKLSLPQLTQLKQQLDQVFITVVV
jgi:hypothetical protein